MQLEEQRHKRTSHFVPKAVAVPCKLRPAANAHCRRGCVWTTAARDGCNRRTIYHELYARQAYRTRQAHAERRSGERYCMRCKPLKPSRVHNRLTTVDRNTVISQPQVIPSPSMLSDRGRFIVRPSALSVVSRIKGVPPSKRNVNGPSVRCCDNVRIEPGSSTGSV